MPHLTQASPSELNLKSRNLSTLKSVPALALIRWQSFSFPPTTQFIIFPIALSANIFMPVNPTGPAKPTGAFVSFSTSKASAIFSSLQFKNLFSLFSLNSSSPLIKIANGFESAIYMRVLTSCSGFLLIKSATASIVFFSGVLTFSIFNFSSAPFPLNLSAPSALSLFAA